MLTILLFFLAMLITMLGLVVLVRGKQIVNNLFALSSFCMAGWCISIAIFLDTNNPAVAVISAKTFYALTIIFGGLLYFLFQVFPRGGVISRKKTIVVSLACLSVLLPLILSEKYITGEVIISPSDNSLLIDRVGYVHFTIVFLVLFYGGLLTALTRYKKLRTRYQKQIKYYALGLLTMSLPGLVTNLFLPAFGNYKYIWLGPLSSTIFIVITTYIIARHRLFDIRLVIARTLAYILSLAFLFCIYALAAFWLASSIFDPANDIVSRIATAIMIMIAAISYTPIKKYFDKLTNQLFYRDAYDPQEFLNELNQTLAGNIELSIIARKSSEIIAKYLKSEYCVISVKDVNTATYRQIGTYNLPIPQSEQSYLQHTLSIDNTTRVVADDLNEDKSKLKEILDRHNIAFIQKLTTVSVNPTKSDAVGYLIVGYRKSGGPYTEQDIRIIEIITSELIIAIQNALRFEEIQDFNATLQKNIDTATIKLQKSNRKLLALDETKDEFISMASHQLRTPLTSVKGYMSMVLEGDAGKLNKQQTELLNQAFFSSQRMVYLIADLLNVSRLKAGKFIIDRHPVNLAEIVESEIAQLTQTAKIKNLVLEYTKPKSFPELMFDETKIRQVIMNFADNAIHYTPPGGRIHLTLSEDKNNVYFTVKDNGLGIPKAEKAKIFTKFFRASNARKARPDGTGLGLFMAKKAVDAQGGNLIFSSHENNGSTFGFTFNKKKLSVK